MMPRKVHRFIEQAWAAIAKSMRMRYASLAYEFEGGRRVGGVPAESRRLTRTTVCVRYAWIESYRDGDTSVRPWVLSRVSGAAAAAGRRHRHCRGQCMAAVCCR